MIQLAQWMSLGNKYLEYGFYVFIAILICIYLIAPIMRYLSKPSIARIELMRSGNKKATLQIWKYYRKKLSGEEKVSFSKITKDQPEEIKNYVSEYLRKQTEEFDEIIKSYAMKLTTTVLISPNPFIDGLSILLGNSRMIYTLSKKVSLRYTWKELWDMYFSVLSISSATGLLEEFDDEIEDIFEDIAEEFTEFIKEETGKSLGDTVPVLNILVKASSPILQAASNYAFVVYNGRRFKYSIINIISDKKYTMDELRKMARKEARKQKSQYIQEMLKKLGLNTTSFVRDQLFKPKKNAAEEKEPNTRKSFFSRKNIASGEEAQKNAAPGANVDISSVS